MSNKPWLLVLLGCGGVALLVFLSCAGVVVYTALNFNNFDSEVSPVVDRLFAQAASGDFGSTYATDTSAELQQTVTREKYEQLGALIETRLGPLKSKSLNRFYVSRKNAERYLDVTYKATFEKGTGTIAARFKKQGDRWLLVSLNVQSPEFQKDLAAAKCPHCGEPHAAGAKFCPKCGKQLTDAEEANEAKPEEAPQKSLTE
jgi:zinc-ribbon domain